MNHMHKYIFQEYKTYTYGVQYMSIVIMYTSKYGLD